MRSSSLRKTTLLSLLGLSSSQSVTWGEPFTVENSATAAASTEALLPTPSQRPGPSLEVATSPPSISDASVISGIQSVVSRDSTFSVSLASTSQSGGTVSTPISGTGARSTTGASPQSTGAAAPAYKKMGVAGVLAGAAGVLLV
ncbi:hypothetical protein BKA66DRAFT_468691 [Pyrenochaeta sp. MPI-SDFR-AT-0127]|nr:hypothetical protein BKA66DRAFT_468691 [Pyrenochaeta sp. MPI-SDFR-AT-0127]